MSDARDETLAVVQITASRVALARLDFETAIKAASRAGATTRAIAMAAGLSHQRIHQILHGR